MIIDDAELPIEPLKVQSEKPCPKCGERQYVLCGEEMHCFACDYFQAVGD